MNELNQARKLLGPWTLEGAIRERVEREATMVWALKADEPFEAIPPMPSQKWAPTPLYAFWSKIAP
jgi:hypothetical protein